MGKDNRKHMLMKKALELSRDDPDMAKGWYTRLSGSDRALLDSGLRELTNSLKTIQSCVNADRLVIEQALATL